MAYPVALGEAIRSANLPLLTQAYLETHTFRQAAAYGIQVPAPRQNKLPSACARSAWK